MNTITLLSQTHHQDQLYPKSSSVLTIKYISLKTTQLLHFCTRFIVQPRTVASDILKRMPRHSWHLKSSLRCD